MLANLKISVVGLTKDEAVAKIINAGKEVRVAEENGKPFILTQDYRRERYNLFLTENKTYKVSFG